jgi:AmmeMemoRadiSam system protein A
MLTDNQRRALVEVARRAIVAQVTRAVHEITDADGFPSVHGAFVTIKRRGELRGCLGTLQCMLGLAEEVARCAADASCRDPRFAPVDAGELPDLTVEVSVLGPLEPVDPLDGATITIGVHGLVVEHGHRRGLLLPQVATEWGWDVEEFKRHTCIKAGLPPDAWTNGARVYRFVAEVFGE